MRQASYWLLALLLFFFSCDLFEPGFVKKKCPCSVCPGNYYDVLDGIDCIDNNLDGFDDREVKFVEELIENNESLDSATVWESITWWPHYGYIDNIHLTDKKITRIPNSIGSLQMVRNVDFSNNNILVLPESICQLSSLNGFDIYLNKLRNLPDCLCNMQNFNLQIASNLLTSLPPCVCDLGIPNFNENCLVYDYLLNFDCFDSTCECQISPKNPYTGHPDNCIEEEYSYCYNDSNLIDWGHQREQEECPDDVR